MKVYLLKYSYSGMETEGAVVEKPSLIVEATSLKHAMWIYHILYFDNTDSFKEFSEWKYSEGGWGMYGKEIDFPKHYADVSKYSNTYENLKKEKDINVYDI